MILYRLRSELKRLVFLRKNREKRVEVAYGSVIHGDSSFEGVNKIGINSYFEGSIGRNSYIGRDSIFFGKIGRYCSVADDVKILIGTHPVNYVSTCPSFYSLLKQNGESFIDVQKFEEYIYADADNKYGIIIGNDVWIGDGATIMGGVTIGDGAVVAAKAIVTKDIPPYAIVGGIPAKLIRYRFSEDQIFKLLKIQWWNWLAEDVKARAASFDNIDRFIGKYYSEILREKEQMFL